MIAASRLFGFLHPSRRGLPAMVALAGLLLVGIVLLAA
jgi:hypothetical protein